MNDTCPQCGCPLRKQPPKSVPLPGQHRLLAWRTVLRCPACGGGLRPNPRPREQQLSLFNWAVYLLSVGGWGWTGDIRYFLGGMLLSGLAEIGLALWLRRRQPDWPRYVAEPERR